MTREGYWKRRYTFRTTGFASTDWSMGRSVIMTRSVRLWNATERPLDALSLKFRGKPSIVDQTRIGKEVTLTSEICKDLRSVAMTVLTWTLCFTHGQMSIRCALARGMIHIGDHDLRQSRNACWVTLLHHLEHLVEWRLSPYLITLRINWCQLSHATRLLSVIQSSLCTQTPPNPSISSIQYSQTQWKWASYSLPMDIPTRSMWV